MEDTMEMDGAIARTQRMEEQLPTVLCCLCGIPITANASNMCVNCIRGQVDITEHIPKQSSIYYCKNCARYLQPPKHWIAAELESKELLTLCIKRLKGLNKLKLIDAGFRWTEPHSRRIHVRLLVQKEVFNNTILQQEFVVEYVVEYQQCDMCKREAADIDEWQAIVQVRQKVLHKRTFLYLEQLILKHNAQQDTVGIKTHPDGLDFYFYHRSHALKFQSFLNHIIPIRSKLSDHLISHDANSNTYRYKYTFSTEILPLCKDDLLCLPQKISTILGGIGPVVIVTKVSTSVTLLDPFTLQSSELSSHLYWKYPFRPMLSFKQGIEFNILDVDDDMNNNEQSGKWKMVDCTIVRSIDYGMNDSQHFIRTHLGNFLKPGDLALGYDISNAVINDSLFNDRKKVELPDFILFKKTFAKKNRSKRRLWRLKRLNMELDESVVDTANRKSALDPIARMAAEQEEFMQDLEQDHDLRAGVNLYKDPTKLITKGLTSMELDDNNDNNSSEVNDNKNNSNIATDNTKNTTEPDDHDEDDENEEYPEVPITELLDGLVLGDEEQEEGEGEEENDDDTTSNNEKSKSAKHAASS